MKPEEEQFLEEYWEFAREQADVASQRPLHEKGVRYRDENDRHLDKEQESRPGSGDYEAYRKAARDRALARMNGKFRGHER